MRAVSLLVLLVGCGTLPLTSGDGGSEDDGALPDVTIDAPSDATVTDAAKDSTAPKDAIADSVEEDTTVDSTVDAASDVTVEASCYSDAGTLDAFVNLDATTAGWGVAPIYGALLGVAVDSNGDVLVGGVNIPSSTQFFYVQMLNATGTSLWTNSPTSQTGISSANDVAFDVWGNAYAAGYTTGTVDVGGGAVGPGGFIVKYDPKGNFVWEYGPFAHTTFNKIRTQSNGVVVAVGTITGSENYGGGTLTPVGGGKAVLVQISSCESFIRAEMWGGTNGAQEIRELAVGPSDELFISGTFQDSIDFGGGTLNGPTNTSNVNFFIAKLDANGGYAHQMDTQCDTDPGYTAIEGLSTDLAGNVFVAGVDRNSINLGTGTMTAIGQCDIVIGKLDSTLSPKWASHFGKPVTCCAFANSVAADPTGSVAITGSYSGCDGMTLTGDAGVPNGQNFFAARFDSNGATLATFGVGNGTGYGGPTAMSFVQWPDFVVTGGQCTGNMTFPYGTLACGGSTAKGFAVRFPP